MVARKRVARAQFAVAPSHAGVRLWQSGQFEEARKEAAMVLRINPGFTIESSKHIFVYKNPKDLEHLMDGMRKVGLPES